ncbi:MAG: hypothetical protein C4589_07790 [Peptococcaceae bacterium]|nr:MAG: hypothetical protein C4589_07790 [Peptococcaceae bacterium]
MTLSIKGFTCLMGLVEKVTNYMPGTVRNNKNDKLLFQLLLIIYLLCFSFSVIILHTFEVRPIIYYIVITIIATVVLLEILFFDTIKNKSNIVLLQIMLLSLNIIWGVSLKYFFFIGRTDPIVHAWYIDNLLNYGHVTDVFEIYKSFPLWHILCSFIYYVPGLYIPSYKIMFITNGLIYSMAIPTIFIISMKIFKNKKVALLQSLFVCFYPSFIYFGMSSIARDIVSFLELILILLLLDKNIPKKLLAIILTFIMIIYHTASMPFIIIIFFVIFLLQKTYHIKEKKFITVDFLILAVVMSLFYWIYIAHDLFLILIDNAFSTSPSGVLTKSIIYTPLNELINYLQYALWLIFIIYGVLWSLQSKIASDYAKIFCLAGFLMVTVTFPGPALLLNKLASSLNLGRFEEYIFLFISMVGAVGLMGMFYKSNIYSKIFAISLFSLMCFLSISNDFTASDNPMVKRLFYTFYLTREEIVAFEHVVSITGGYLMSDYITTRYLKSSPYMDRSHILEVDGKNMKFLRNNEEDILLIRIQELNKRPLKFFTSGTGKFELDPSWRTFLDYYHQDLPLWNALKKNNKIYSSGGVESFN